MRLICPNCGAQYEVPDEVIPDSGRDVQCSSCGDTWFQHHPDHAPEPDAEEGESEHPGWDSPPEPDPEPDPEPAPVADDPEPESEPEPETETQAPKRRQLGSEVTGVLREEAAREEEARASSGLETQPDLGLGRHDDSADLRGQQAKARMERLRGAPKDAQPDDDDMAGDIDPASRRNLLPDIEEINSSLNSDPAHGDPGPSARDTGAEAVVPARKSGFRRGFMLIVLLALVLLLLYVFAPQLAEKVPALKGALSTYVDMVNDGRVWLREQVSSLMGGT